VETIGVAIAQMRGLGVAARVAIVKTEANTETNAEKL
jgi:hypothetical protein